jgi:hypothetical protein
MAFSLSTSRTGSDSGKTYVKTNAPRSIAVIGGVVLIAFGLGYTMARPDAPGTAVDPSQAGSAVRAALQKPNELERAAGLAPYLATLDASHLDAVVGAYEATFTSVGPGSVALEMLAEAWSKVDPAGAFQRILGWDVYWRGTTLPLLVRSWARHDHASARAAVEAMRPGWLRDRASYAVIHGWADTGDPAVWDGFVAGLPFASNVSYNLLQRIAARDGIDAMLRRAESVPEDAGDGFRATALRQAVDITAQIDPERAAAYAEQRRGAAEGPFEGAVARRWAASDGPRAMEWVLSQPAGPVRDAALRSAFGAWLRSDRQAAFDWAERQPDEQVAPILTLYATEVGRNDLQRGLEISVGIADPAERHEAQLPLAKAWLRQQPAIAIAWLEKNDLADLVAEIRSTARQGPRSRAGQPGAGKVD